MNFALVKSRKGSKKSLLFDNLSSHPSKPTVAFKFPKHVLVQTSHPTEGDNKHSHNARKLKFMYNSYIQNSIIPSERNPQPRVKSMPVWVCVFFSSAG
ncbi:hypothetical protein VIGAN_01053800 [Vigna angularis var. angularis]|uniref:Uncharacterized protein n=1 Tax=Vigna angularis var. angularis TaxID=157739 RepID=A0A0S3QXL0_PHAAN|nr:hypothetical protein VIGAN_01053800 [Vigna angularis var. angularis]